MDIILDGDYPRTILDKFSSIPSSGSQEKDLINFHFFNQSDAVILGLMMSKVTWHNFGRGPFKFGPIWFSSSWEVQNVKQQTADAKWWEELE